MKYDVFISYSSKNSTAAIAICHLLEDSGVRCWMAPRDIPLGEKYATVITKAIKGCKAVVLVFSEQSAISPWVESEINIAFSQHKPIFPYKIDSVKLEEHDEFYLMLNSRHWIDSYPDYRTRFHELVDAVCRAIGKPTPVKESATESATESASHTNSDRNIRSVKMSQRVIKIAISLIVVVLGIIYLASLFADDEKCPDNEIWYTSIDNQPLSLKDDEFDVKIYSNAYIDDKGIITFDGELTTIGDLAFYNCSSLTSVTIPDSVTTIGDGVFADCSSLAEFKGKFAADGGRCLIKDNAIIAYANASGTTYTLPDSVTTIGRGAFYGCSSLTSVTIPDSVTTIGDYAFYYCSSPTSVVIPDSVTTIGENAFYLCSSLTSVTIPGSVTTIGHGAFTSCKSLTEFKGKFAADGGRCLIKDNTIIAYAVASGTTYTIPDSVTTIGDEAFAYCYSLTSVTIPDSVTTIGYGVFDSCSNLTSVTIGDSVTTIGDYAFSDCDSLTSVTIPGSVTTIGGYAFYYCRSLTSVTIPDSVTTIGEDAFYSCDSLTSVYCEATTPPTLGGSSVGSSVFDNNASGRKIYVPVESVEAYKSATNWSEYAENIVGYDF